MDHDAMMSANDSDMMAGMMHGGMRMTFYFGLNLMLLFEAWRIRTVGELAGAIVAVFFMAVLYEGLKTLREFLVYLTVRQMKKKCSKCSTPSDVKDHPEKEPQGKCGSHRHRQTLIISVSMHLVQTSLHIIQIGYGYLLMLVAMTYNGWLFLSICFGAGVGYLLFARGRSLMRNFQDQNECCN